VIDELIASPLSVTGCSEEETKRKDAS